MLRIKKVVKLSISILSNIEEMHRILIGKGTVETLKDRDRMDLIKRFLVSKLYLGSISIAAL